MSRGLSLLALAAIASAFAVPESASRRPPSPLPTEKAKRDAASKRRNKAKKGGRS